MKISSYLECFYEAVPRGPDVCHCNLIDISQDYLSVTEEDGVKNYLFFNGFFNAPKSVHNLQMCRNKLQKLVYFSQKLRLG